MFTKLLRQSRRAKAKRAHSSWKKRQSQIDRERAIEEELGFLKKAVEPDVYFSKNGISVGIHVCRRWGKPDPRFEFFAKVDPARGNQSIFSAGDLELLQEAVEKAKSWVQEQK